MVTGVQPTRKPTRKAAGPALSQAQRQIEMIRTTIPGEGVYLVAEVKDYPNRAYPAVHPDFPGLALVPGRPVPLDEIWLTSPYLIRDFQAGHVKIEQTNVLPGGTEAVIDEALANGLDQNQRQFVIEVARLPFTRQFKDAVCLADTLPANGIPRDDTRRVTKHYLKSTHLILLNALLDLERRAQKREDVLLLVEQQIRKIEAL